MTHPNHPELATVEPTLQALDLQLLRRRHSLKWRAFGPEVLAAWVAEMDFPVADPVSAAVRAALDRGGDLGYAPDAQISGLAQAYVEWTAREHGLSLDPRDVVATADVVHGLEAVLATLTAPGDPVVVTTPIYPPFLELVTGSGRRLVEVPLVADGPRWALDLDALEAAFVAGARAWLVCSPHNPTGSVPSLGELMSAAELAARHGVLVVADEIHAPLTYPEAQHVPLAGLPVPGLSVVTVTSATKAWNFPALTCAVVHTADPVARQVVAGWPVRHRMAGLLGVDASVAAWRDGGPWLGQVMGVLDGNRRRLAGLLAEHAPEVRYQVPQATYLAWLDLRAYGLPAPATFLREHGGLAVNEGADFGRPGQGWVRLNFACSPEMLTDAVTRLGRAITPGG
ncbi:MAG: MalY/PatB family protein [Actinomycetes bacterium]